MEFLSNAEPVQVDFSPQFPAVENETFLSSIKKFSDDKCKLFRRLLRHPNLQNLLSDFQTVWKCFHTSNKIASAWRNKRIIIYFKSLLCFYRLSFFRAPRICAVNLFFKGGTIPRFLTIYICSPSQDISLNGIVKFLWSHLLSCHCF